MPLTLSRVAIQKKKEKEDESKNKNPKARHRSKWLHATVAVDLIAKETVLHNRVVEAINIILVLTRKFALTLT